MKRMLRKKKQPVMEMATPPTDAQNALIDDRYYTVWQYIVGYIGITSSVSLYNLVRTCKTMHSWFPSNKWVEWLSPEAQKEVAPIIRNCPSLIACSRFGGQLSCCVCKQADWASLAGRLLRCIGNGGANICDKCVIKCDFKTVGLCLNCTTREVALTQPPTRSIKFTAACDECKQLLRTGWLGMDYCYFCKGNIACRGMTKIHYDCAVLESVGWSDHITPPKSYTHPIQGYRRGCVNVPLQHFEPTIQTELQAADQADINHQLELSNAIAIAAAVSKLCGQVDVLTPLWVEFGHHKFDAKLTLIDTLKQYIMWTYPKCIQ